LSSIRMLSNANPFQTEKETSSVCGKDRYSWNTDIRIFSEYAGCVKKQN
jgi:hypothetical protein